MNAVEPSQHVPQPVYLKVTQRDVRVKAMGADD